MNLIQKISYLQDKHFSEWLKARSEATDEASINQTMFCVCGRLATGLHESHCKKFQNRITQKTVEKLKHLIKN